MMNFCLSERQCEIKNKITTIAYDSPSGQRSLSSHSILLYFNFFFLHLQYNFNFSILNTCLFSFFHSVTFFYIFLLDFSLSYINHKSMYIQKRISKMFVKLLISSSSYLFILFLADYLF